MTKFKFKKIIVVFIFLLLTIIGLPTVMAACNDRINTAYYVKTFGYDDRLKLSDAQFDDCQYFKFDYYSQSLRTSLDARAGWNKFSDQAGLATKILAITPLGAGVDFVVDRIEVARGLALELSWDLDIVSGAEKSHATLVGQIILASGDLIQYGRFESEQDLFRALNMTEKLSKIAEKEALNDKQKAKLSLAVLANLGNITKRLDGKILIDQKKYQQLLETKQKDVDLKATLSKLKTENQAFYDFVDKTLNSTFDENLINKLGRINPKIKELAEKIKTLEETQKLEEKNHGQEIIFLKENLALETDNTIKKAISKNDYLKRKRKINEAGHAVSFFSGFMSLMDPEKAEEIHKMTVVAQAVLQITDATNEIMAEALGAVSLGPYVAILHAGTSIFNILGKKKGPNPDEVILRQIKRLGKQLEGTRLQLNARFDRVEEVLGQGFTTVTRQIIDLGSDIRSLEQKISDMNQSLEKLHQLMGRSDQKFTEVWTTKITGDYYYDRNQALFKEDYSNKPLSSEDFEKYKEQFHRFGVDLAKSSLLTGFSFQGANDHTIAKELFGANPLLYINSLASHSGVDSGLVSPEAWVSSTGTLLTLFSKYPAYQNQVGPKIYSELIEEGDRVLSFVNQLQKNTKAIRDVFNNYNRALSEIFSEINQEKHKFYQERFHTPWLMGLADEEVLAQNINRHLSGANYLLDDIKATVSAARRGMRSFGSTFESSFDLFLSQHPNQEFYGSKERTKQLDKPYKTLRPCTEGISGIKYPGNDATQGIKEAKIISNDLIEKFLPKTYLEAEILGLGTSSICYELELGHTETITPQQVFKKRINQGLPIKYDIPSVSRMKNLKIYSKVKKIKVRSFFTSSVTQGRKQVRVVQLNLNGSGREFCPVLWTEYNTLNTEYLLNPNQSLYSFTMLFNLRLQSNQEFISIVGKKPCNFVNLIINSKVVDVAYLSDDKAAVERAVEASISLVRSQLLSKIKERIDSSPAYTSLAANYSLLQTYAYYSLNNSYLDDLDFRSELSLRNGLLNPANFRELLFKLEMDLNEESIRDNEIKKSMNFKRTYFKKLMLAKKDPSLEAFAFIEGPLNVLKNFVEHKPR